MKKSSTSHLKLSKLATEMISTSISGLSEKIDEKREKGQSIFNFTLGDFSPTHFPIPALLEEEIINAYRQKQTNYPFVGGMRILREAIAKHIKRFGDFDYQPDEIIVTSGARPLTYLLFRMVVNPGEKIIYTVPSWNNQHYIYLANAKPIVITASPENNFLITAKDLKPHIKKAALITMNSPLNPSGTIFDRKTLKEIFDLVVVENKRRILKKQKPIYIFFDIIYWLLIYNEKKYQNPLKLNKKIKDYVIFIDGISKCFASTGVRVGWAFGPKPIIAKMRTMLADLGAWTPKPEQMGTARFLQNNQAVTNFMTHFKKEIYNRLNIFYTTIQDLKSQGYKVDAITPQGALYLSIKFDLIGAKTRNNKMLNDIDDVLNYLLEEAKIGIVPFYFFGIKKTLPWFRLSVGTCSMDEAKQACEWIKKAVTSLK
jgi:aspartate aminotransferase